VQLHADYSSAFADTLARRELREQSGTILGGLEGNMKIHCEVEEIELEGDYGDVPSVQATCSDCGHETTSFGTSDASVRRCLVVMREECPKRRSNLYVSGS
jgi:hypothetical protein